MDISCKSRLDAGMEIDGVDLRRLHPNNDARGSFTEVFQQSWGSIDAPCQWSIVKSETNVFRGCHLHQRHDEYICILSGKATVGLRDERPDSDTKGVWSLYELHGDDPRALIFPAGLVHGWYFHTETMHLQAVTESYETYHADDNYGVHWSDPDLQIPWPFTNPVLASRADQFSTLTDLRQKISEIAAD